MDVLGRENQISKMGQARFEAVFYHASFGIDIIDETGRIVDCNPAFEKMFGYARSELRAMTYMDLTHPDDIVEGRNLHLDLLAGKCANFQIEKRYVRKDQSILWARLTMSLFETETSDSQLVMGMIEDITDQKDAESAQHFLENQLFQAERMATVGTVASGIVHNLKGPLTRILGFADLLSLKFPDEKFIARIQTATKQMNEMVENILVKGRQKPKPEYVDLEHLLRRELEFLATDRYYKTGVKTQVSFGDDVPPFLCAYTDLSQIFGNLLRNAVEAMYDREKKELGISTYVKAGFICVDIQDSGCGIAQERVATLFDAFVTTKDGDGKTAPQGTGLGLYMVRQLLEQYDACIEVFSEEDVGTLFQVRLPLSDETS